MKKRTIKLSRIANPKDYIILPVNPPNIQVTTGQKHQTIDLLNTGEVLLLGKRALDSISLSSFFPDKSSPLYKRGKAKKGPWAYYNKLKSWRVNNQLLRLIIGGGGSNINMAVSIEKLVPEIREGDPDLYYSIDLKEYRRLNVSPVQTEGIPQQNGLLFRADTRKRPKIHTVKNARETFYYIACKYYGDGSQWKKLATANGKELAYDTKVGDKVKLI